MKITKMSIITGIEHTLEVDVTDSQLREWESGVVIQRAMPELSADMREFLITGITPEEWKEHMEEED
jgi:uncharacterized NAD-dependent epimerase/dehydratase family protein